MRVLLPISRIAAGGLFIFSGIVKAIDPLGSAYKFHDYFIAFGLNSLQSLSLPLAILLCMAEFIAGLSVLTGIRFKEGAWLMFLLIIFFTPLTFILALTNPVSDCGCFGDAVHLTNWQTFGKNIILLAFISVIFINRKKSGRWLSTSMEWITEGAAVIVFCGFAFYNLRYLPVIDFLPYRIGTNIREKMIIPEGAPVDRYETTFIYKKNGESREFTLDNYPANDTSWVFVDQKSRLISKGYEPPIHNFSISTLNNTDITDSILDSKGYTLLMISTKLENAKNKSLVKGLATGMAFKAQGISFFVVTASGTDVVKKYENGLTFCQADETTLKTVVRSNPGYLLIRDGKIEGKWSWANLPTVDRILKK